VIRVDRCDPIRRRTTRHLVPAVHFDRSPATEQNPAASYGGTAVRIRRHHLLAERVEPGAHFLQEHALAAELF